MADHSPDHSGGERHDHAREHADDHAREHVRDDGDEHVDDHVHDHAHETDHGPDGSPVDVPDGASLRALLDAEGAPTAAGDSIFASPWQARAFGLAVALRGDDGPVAWRDFQERLAAEIAGADSAGAVDGSAVVDDPAAVDDEYYHRWLAALERLAVDKGLVDEDRLRERAAAFDAGDRTAAEFVQGHHEH